MTMPIWFAAEQEQIANVVVKGDYFGTWEKMRVETKDEWDEMTKEEQKHWRVNRDWEFHRAQTMRNWYGRPTEGGKTWCFCSDWSQQTIGVCQGKKCKKRGHEVHNHIAAAIKRGEMAAKIYYEGNWIMPGG